MGVVFAAEDDSLGRRVAVKTIAEPDDSARKRFRREARAAAGVNHPNICQVYEIGEDGGQLFIAMELLEGESLADRLRRGPLPVEEAVALGRGMLAALSALHTTGVVHRDLKPSNVFLTPHGVKLLDFGLARPLPKELTQSLETGTELTRPGLLVGTPRYMAPEQVLGHEVDARTDLFSAAAILYEGVSGRAAFLGTTVVEVLSATLHEQPPALAGDAAVVALDRVLRRALAKRPADRPASAAEMAAEMDRVAAAGTSTATSVRRPLTRLVVLPFRLLRPDPEIDFLSFALADAVSASLAGLPSVVIRSSAAAARFATESPDLKALAAQADVDRVLMGTLLRAGEQLRATAQLVEAPAGTLVSSQTLQAPLGDVFRLQDELAQRIVESLSPSLSEREGRRRGVPASARAYEFYLRANEVVRDWSHVAVARDLYRQCVDEDPSFAPGVGQARPLPPPARQVLPRPARGEPGPRRRGLPARPRARPRRCPWPTSSSPTARRRWAAPATPWCDCSGSPARPATTPRSSPASSTPAATAASWRPPRRLTARRGGSTRTSRRASSTPGGPGATWSGSSRRRRTPGTSSCGRWLSRRWGGRTRPGRACTRPRPRPSSRCSRRSSGPCVALSTGARRRPRPSPSWPPRTRTPRRCSCTGPAWRRIGDTARAHCRRSTPAVDGGFTVPQALRHHPWLAPLREASTFGLLVARAEAARDEAQRAFQAAGGPALLGA